MPPTTTCGALSELVSRSFIVIDWATEEVLIRTFIRNDEGYKHPNVLKSIHRAVVETESAALRFVLHDELRKLPQHKDIDTTLAVADALVKGISDAISIPSRSHPDAVEILPVVGTYVSSKEPTTTTTCNSNGQPEHTRTFTEMATVGANAPAPPPPDRHVGAEAKRIVADEIPERLAVRSATRAAARSSCSLTAWRSR